MKHRIKILILGIGQSNFLNQLYSRFIENDTYEFIIDSYRDLGKSQKDYANKIYSYFLDLKSRKISSHKYILNFIDFYFSRFFWKLIFFEISQNSSISSIFIKVRKLFLAKNRASIINDLDIDVIQVHFCIPENVYELYFLSDRFKIICSFWGSDLLRETGVDNVFYIKRALELTDVITIQTKELAEVLMTKYGRKFKPKLEILRFVLNEDILDEIDKSRNDISSKISFKKSYKIPIDKKVITIGHNLSPFNNHIEILRNLAKLSVCHKERIVVLIPAAYGGSAKYLDELKSFIPLLEDLEIILLTEFFEPDKISLLRLISDIFIHLPETDALSASVTENLYAGNRVITGSWLPYKFYSLNEIYLDYIDSYEDIEKKVDQILFLNNVRAETLNNINKIKHIFDVEKTADQWLKLYNKLNITSVEV